MTAHSEPGHSVNVQAIPHDGTYLLECDHCGLLTLEDPDDVDGAAFTHLQDVHGVDDITWDIHP